MSAEAQVATSAAIELHSLTHNYGPRVALDGLSFAVGTAEIFGLLGPNGSGKTTLFRILSTLMLPSTGHAHLMGADVASSPMEARWLIGVVFQASSVDKKLSAAENLRHQGHLYGLRGTPLEGRIAEMLARVGLADRADERVESFSGGLARRVEIAKGLMHRPKVLLLDEPTTGLDPGARRDLWQYLRTLQQEENVTVLITTHLMEEAERCDRLAILNQGRLVALGTPADLKSEIGGEVVTLDAREPQALAEKIAARFSIAPQVIDGKLRLEITNGHRFVAEVFEVFPGEIEAISVNKPTLEDVFIHRTGHRFWSEGEPA